jgi:uncharacterized protein YndB with AHSA1/START domain
MEKQNRVATAETTIHALPERVWKALTDPEEIKEYMMGANVRSEWEVGSAITWSGEWQGKTYEDKGEIKTFDENIKLEYTHYSPMSGLEDAPENYHNVTVSLEKTDDNQTKVTLSQDGNNSEEEKEHSTKNWQGMLDGLKKLVEGKG